MALQEIDGGNFIDRIFSKVQTGENFIFDSYLPLSSMKFEKWDSQLYDDDSFVTNNLWKSSQGSSIAFTKSTSGNGAYSKKTTSLNIVGIPDNLKLSSSEIDFSSENSSNINRSISLSYIGDKTIKGDDLTWKQSGSSKNSEGSEAINSESVNVDLSNTDWDYKFSQSVSGRKLAWKATGSMSLSDKSEKTSFSMSFTFASDVIKDTVNLSLSVVVQT